MKIGIFGNEYQAENQLREIFRILKESRVEISVQKDFYEYIKQELNIQNFGGILDCNTLPIDIALSVGGDGTFLRTAMSIRNRNIPILGINTGRLGFLADTNELDLEESLKEVVSGKFSLKKRVLLEFLTENNPFSENRFALNEVAILKQDSAAMLTIHAEIDGQYLNSYLSDGLIISTPTGSTGYSLSVGGPIMAPNTDGLIVVPIAPHSLNVRPLVVSDTSELRLTVESRNNSFLASIDGRSAVLNSDVTVTVKKADFLLNVIKVQGHTFYKTLREKLMWGVDAREKS